MPSTFFKPPPPQPFHLLADTSKHNAKNYKHYAVKIEKFRVQIRAENQICFLLLYLFWPLILNALKKKSNTFGCEQEQKVNCNKLIK